MADFSALRDSAVLRHMTGPRGGKLPQPVGLAIYRNGYIELSFTSLDAVSKWAAVIDEPELVENVGGWIKYVGWVTIDDQPRSIALAKRP